LQDLPLDGEPLLVGLLLCVQPEAVISLLHPVAVVRPLALQLLLTRVPLLLLRFSFKVMLLVILSVNTAIIRKNFLG
jgi:hypothetical protein